VDKIIPGDYRDYLDVRDPSILAGAEQQKIRLRGFTVGAFLSLFLAIGDPYGSMVIRGTYMATDFNTLGAIFLFLFLIGVLNLLFKLGGRSNKNALGLCLLAVLGWGYAYWPFDAFDIHSPGLIFSTFLLVCALVNVTVVRSGRQLALNRAELILVYVMMLIVSALCTMGLGQQILPMITAIFYYASPENKWAEKLFPHFPNKNILVNDGAQNVTFYEGLSGADIPYEVWVEPLLWWTVFLLALYAVMVSVAVILRRQWIERERLAYPIAQVGLAMIRNEESAGLVNGFFKHSTMWIGCALPMIYGSLKGLHHYYPSVPVPGLTWGLSLVGIQSLQMSIRFDVLGFSYFIHSQIAAGLWFFHILSKFEKEILNFSGLRPHQVLIYGVNDQTFLGYQGAGALIAMVLAGLWFGREHLKNVLRKALGRGPQIDDSDEIISYRAAVIGSSGGCLVMVGWLWVMGTPLSISLLLVTLAVLIFVGITRIVTEAGLVIVRAPMIAPDLIVHGLGSALVGPTGVFNLSMTYMWAADVRVFVMGTCTTALKMINEMDRRSRRLVFWGLILALLIGALGSCWMIFHLVYRYGAINTSTWFFSGGPQAAYTFAMRNLEPTEVHWPGLGFFIGGGGMMLLLMWLRQRLVWWPVHPIGFPIGANYMMNSLWFSVFLAWLIKVLILRYGGAATYRRIQPFFLGLITGQVLCSGIWLVIDYFTGTVSNYIF